MRYLSPPVVKPGKTPVDLVKRVARFFFWISASGRARFLCDRHSPSLIEVIDEMDSVDLSADLTALPTNHTTRLLSESPLIGRSNHLGLSSSDLSVHDLPEGGRSQSHGVDEDRDEDEVEESLREGGDGEDEEAQIRRARKAARTREEKLQNDLFLLKKLNGAFSLYTDALRATQSSTEVSRYFTPTSSAKVDLRWIRD